METELTFIEKIALIQSGLKAPKDKKASGTKFSYNYRNAEDILAKAKPLLLEQSLIITLDDKIEYIGNKYFISARASITDGTETVSGTACAELLSAQQMNEPQASGATSSYARKYALAGLLGIDDGQDADHEKYQRNYTPEQYIQPHPAKPTLSGIATEKQVGMIEAKRNQLKIANPGAYEELSAWYQNEFGEKPLKELSKAEASKIIDQLNR